MTSNKRFKRRVRTRAAATGESYATARRNLLTATDHPSLEEYLDDAGVFVRLSDDAERALLALAREGDQSAARAVVTSLLAPAADTALHVARGRGLDELNAVAEANLVLLQLVDSSSGAETVSGRLDEAIRSRLSTP